ncbi:MAG TPA: type II 3-dehydroquinate dehydratase [Bacteroidales bacterium]|nr:type II 3-dehydroquinate dehydratase [Bacteroidales bacterium]HPT12747.1 type II 3-dehydroquinate dehydratase [Bacteroidales bacterium]
MNIKIINGPNLNMLGTREPGIYGNTSFDEYLTELKMAYPDITFSYSQSNIEGEIVTLIQEAGSSSDGVILNAGGYSHTSVAIADAVSSIRKPVVEVHISNLLSREEFRHTSLTGKVCKGTIMGFGLDGYRLATEALIKIITTVKNG